MCAQTRTAGQSRRCPPRREVLRALEPEPVAGQSQRLRCVASFRRYLRKRDIVAAAADTFLSEKTRGSGPTRPQLCPGKVFKHTVSVVWRRVVRLAWNSRTLQCVRLVTASYGAAAPNILPPGPLGGLASCFSSRVPIGGRCQPPEPPAHYAARRHRHLHRVGAQSFPSRSTTTCNATPDAQAKCRTGSAPCGRRRHSIAIPRRASGASKSLLSAARPPAAGGLQELERAWREACVGRRGASPLMSSPVRATPISRHRPFPPGAAASADADTQRQRCRCPRRHLPRSVPRRGSRPARSAASSGGAASLHPSVGGPPSRQCPPCVRAPLT